MAYCGKECQRLDWRATDRAGHKNECGLLAALGPTILEKFDLLNLALIRLVANIYRDPTLGKKKVVQVFGRDVCYDDLTSHGDKVIVHPTYGPAVREIHSLLKIRGGMSLSAREIATAYGNVQLNHSPLRFHIDTFHTRLGVMDRQNSVLICGVAIYLDLSLFDHSCLPNAQSVVNGLKRQIRAAADIPPNQPITLQRGDYFQPREENRRFLRDNRFIRCCCALCTGKWKHQRDFDRLVELVREELESRRGRLIRPSLDLSELLEEIIRLTTTIYGPYSVKVFEQLVELFFSKVPADVSNLSEGAKRELKAIYERIMEKARVIYPENYPRFQAVDCHGAGFDGYLKAVAQQKERALHDRCRIS